MLDSPVIFNPNTMYVSDRPCIYGHQPPYFYRPRKCALCGRRSSRNSHSRNREETNRKTAEWRKNNPGYRYAYQLKTFYDLTVPEYRLILARQCGLCAICGLPLIDYQTHVDHDHSCCPPGVTKGDCIRGVLHRPCNQWLGHVEKNLAPATNLARIYLLSASAHIDWVNNMRELSRRSARSDRSRREERGQ